MRYNIILCMKKFNFFINTKKIFIQSILKKQKLKIYRKTKIKKLHN